MPGHGLGHPGEGLAQLADFLRRSAQRRDGERGVARPVGRNRALDFPKRLKHRRWTNIQPITDAQSHISTGARIARISLNMTGGAALRMRIR